MKHLLTLLFVLILSLSFKPGTDNVYICDNKTSTVYHVKKTCSSLNNCKHEIITITKEDAEKKFGKRACKNCR
jgi:hypothetical protein